MRRALVLIVCCLVLSLVIQNTCPFGAAGKSSVVPKCGHCPLMRQCATAPEGQATWSPGSTPSHFPLFLFTAVRLDHTFQVGVASGSMPLLVIHYKEAFPAELLIPPKA